MPILHTFAVKCPTSGDAAMGATLHDLVAGTSANHDTAKGAAVGQLKYYTKPFSWGYRWLATMLMPDQNALAGYGKNPAHDAGVEKMAKIMEGEKQALINFDVEVPSNFALPPSAHILHLVFCKIKDSDEARDGFNSFCYELAELTQGGLGEWPGRLIHFGPMMKQKLSRGYTHVIVLWFTDKPSLDTYMDVHASMVKDKLVPHMVEAPEKGGSFLAEIDVPDEKQRLATWKGLGARL